MGSLTVMERPEVVSADFSEWVEQGRSLIQRRRDADWALADWWNEGRKAHKDEPQFKLFAEGVGEDAKGFTAMAKVAEAFPAHMRASNLSFKTHEVIATLEPSDRLTMLREASQGGWKHTEAHEHVYQRKVEQGTLLPEDDPGFRRGEEFIRCWNRMQTPEEREYIWPYLKRAAATGFGPIDMDDCNA